jgi:nucleoside-diphosphate-sugar epimerase
MAKVAALGSEALLAACAELPRPPHFVHIGSGFEYAPQDRPVRESDPVIPSATRYGAAKAAASAVVGGFAGMLPITIVRPFNVFGAGDTAPRLGSHVVAQAMAGNRIETTLGGQLRDFLHADDFGRLLWDIAASPASQSDFAIYNAGSTEPRLLRAYIEAIAEALTDAGYPAEIAYGAVAYRPGEPMIAIPDTERLTAGFAWQPRIDFASGVKDFVNWTIARCA